MSKLETIPLARLLVGVDGSPSSIHALRYAARLAKAFEGTIEAVSIWEFPMTSGYHPVLDWSPEADAESILADAIDLAFGATPPYHLSTSVSPGPIAKTLIDRSRHADLLVLGSRGHGGFVGLLLGSVSTTCVQHAHCPVLIVRTPPSDTEPVTADMLASASSGSGSPASTA